MASFQVALIFFAFTLSGSLVKAKETHIGCYYGAWSYTRPGLGEFWPEDIDVNLCDVIYYGFGNVLNDTFEVCSWDPWFDMAMTDGDDGTIKNCIQERDGVAWPPGCVTEDGLEYCQLDGIRRTVALKQRNPNLKVLFSVGGWTAGGWIFSIMAETHENRQKFIKSAVHFIKYFGLDGLDVDWEYPGYDMLPEVPTNPKDKEHFTLLMSELHQAFDHDGYLLTFAAAPDPFKAANAFELDKVKDYVDWINLMSYDYSGGWDPFTGIDAPLYGRWGEGFYGHPKYQFNIHETILHYLNEGFPAEKIVLGVHTESKAWILNTPDPEHSGFYCPGTASPNMTYSRQEGWLNYYEILQFWHNETVEDPLWDKVVLGRENWNIFDHENGKVDGCYLSPHMYQGQYWVSYDDEASADLKARYANHHGLKGAFVWEVDTDNFRGLYGKENYTILSALRRGIESGKGLEPHEILGKANENKDCPHQVPFCDTDFNVTLCSSNKDCNDDPTVICNSDLDNCFYCDEGACRPGCSDNQNCADPMMCSGEHNCFVPGLPLISAIVVSTKACEGCSTDFEEPGLKLSLVGKYGAECNTSSLDNVDLHDYVLGHAAVFKSKETEDSPDDGLGGCNRFDLNIGLEGGSAMWTGEGSWTPGEIPHTDGGQICVYFHDPEDNKPICCCKVGDSPLFPNVSSDLVDCECFRP